MQRLTRHVSVIKMTNRRRLKIKKRLENKKNVKNVKNVTKIKKRKKRFYIYETNYIWHQNMNS